MLAEQARKGDESLLQHCDVAPHVNQFEMHPALPQAELAAYCGERGIQVVAYASLGVGALLENGMSLSGVHALQQCAQGVIRRWVSSRSAACAIGAAASKQRRWCCCGCGSAAALLAAATATAAAAGAGESPATVASP